MPVGLCTARPHDTGAGRAEVEHRERQEAQDLRHPCGEGQAHHGPGPLRVRTPHLRGDRGADADLGHGHVVRQRSRVQLEERYRHDSEGRSCDTSPATWQPLLCTIRVRRHNDEPRDGWTGRQRRCDWVFQRSRGRSSISCCCSDASTTTVAQQGGDGSSRLDTPTVRRVVRALHPRPWPRGRPPPKSEERGVSGDAVGCCRLLLLEPWHGDREGRARDGDGASRCRRPLGSLLLQHGAG